MNLPADFEWFTLDCSDINSLALFLQNNYIEDDQAMFRFAYTPDFLQWTLMPPYYIKDWLVGVRVIKNKNIVGFISAVPATINNTEMAIINFLCVHKKIRNKKLARILIQEITRRVKLANINNAVYTSGSLYPNKIASCQYYHRVLNPKKLIDIGFSSLSKNMTLARMIKLYNLPKEARKIVEFDLKDVDQVCELLNNRKGTVVQTFSTKKVEHLFLKRKNVVYSYVVKENGKITEFVSFYLIPSSILQNDKHKTLYCAYSFYNVFTSIDTMKDVLIVAKNEGADVFNCLDIANNVFIFKPLHFKSGNGYLYYYMFGDFGETETKDVNLVLV